MKHKRLILCTLLAAALGSCARPLSEKDGNLPPGDEELVQVFFRTDEDGSKVTDADGDDLIRRWAVFVFDQEAPWSAYATSSQQGHIPMTLRRGRNYHCCAVVNYPLSGPCALVPSAIQEEARLHEKITALDDNAPDAFVMYGRTTLQVTEASQQVGIPVRRTVSRIDVQRIEADFGDNSTLASKTFTLKHIYLTNVYRTTRYGADYSFAELSDSRSAWYNTMGRHRGEEPVSGMDALLEERDLNFTLRADRPYTVRHSFYVCPNPTPPEEDSHDSGFWSKRSSRIVLETALDGETLYYQATLPEMARNHLYVAGNIRIRGKGSKDPEELVYDPEDPPIVIDWHDEWDRDDEKEI